MPEILIAYHALQTMGGVPCLLHMPYRAGEIEPLLRHGDAKAVICWAGIDGYDAPATMLGLRDRIPSLQTVIVAGGPAPGGTLAFDALYADLPLHPFYNMFRKRQPQPGSSKSTCG